MNWREFCRRCYGLLALAWLAFVAVGCVVLKLL